jgi:DNA-binding transcriptional ArsR family regulator
MDSKFATDAFGALAQETRLAVFRLLVEAGAEGMPAGDIARYLGTPHNTMSTHLAILARAGLVGSRRESRSVIYSANYAGIRALTAFLLQDCCRARADVCTPLLDAALTPTAARCCPPPSTAPTEH